MILLRLNELAPIHLIAVFDLENFVIVVKYKGFIMKLKQNNFIVYLQQTDALSEKLKWSTHTNMVASQSYRIIVMIIPFSKCKYISFVQNKQNVNIVAKCVCLHAKTNWIENERLCHSVMWIQIGNAKIFSLPYLRFSMNFEYIFWLSVINIIFSQTNLFTSK